MIEPLEDLPGPVPLLAVSGNEKLKFLHVEIFQINFFQLDILPLFTSQKIIFALTAVILLPNIKEPFEKGSFIPDLS